MENTNDLTASVLYPDGSTELTETSVVSEHILNISVNDELIYRLVCTRDSLRELVAGRLFTDGLIEDTGDIHRIYFCKYENEANVLLNRQITWEESDKPEPTCCAGNRVYAKGSTRLRKLPPYQVNTEHIFSLIADFQNGTKLHDMTSGVHICILAKGGKTLYTASDIGRHNAVDKAVGYALLNDIPLKDCMLFTSGRVPTDMVEKVIAAGIPVLVSKSVPTAESVELAKKYGLVLICRAWPDKCECFSGSHGSDQGVDLSL